MKGISRRARTCAVVAATGVAVLGSSAVASAQRAPSMGDGLPVGQTGMQMFNFSRYISGTAAEQKAKVEEVFAMLQSKGIRVVEPYSLHSMSAADFRALADKYNLHVVGRHGGVAENTFDSEIATAKTLGQRGSRPGHLRPDAGHRGHAEPPRQALRHGRRGQGLHPQPHR
jgi:hypothetical protein